VRSSALWVAMLVALPASGSGQDGPWSWVHPTPQGHPLNAVAWVDDQTAVAVGETGTIVRSGDGDASWRIVAGGAAPALRGVAFAPVAGSSGPAAGVAVGRDGTLLRSEDGGATWRPAASGATRELRAVAFADPRTVVVVGAGGAILRSMDAGATWAAVRRRWSPARTRGSAPGPCWCRTRTT
jgi:photosystem II stability/assembly factor-like uncharacterized protein